MHFGVPRMQKYIPIINIILNFETRETYNSLLNNKNTELILFLQNVIKM